LKRSVSIAATLTSCKDNIMSKLLSFNLKDSKGEQRFITPLVTVENGGKVTMLDKAIRLAIGYIVKAIVEADGYTDKTKLTAGVNCHETLASLPKSAKVNLYMPTLCESRDSDDLAKWTLVASVPMPEMAATSKALNDANAIMVKAEASIDTIKAGVKNAAYDVTQPVYFAAEAGATKRSSGDKKITITLK